MAWDLKPWKDYAQGKQLTISVDDAAAGALYAAAMGASSFGAFGAFSPVPQGPMGPMATQIASDPMACQIVWQKDGTPGSQNDWQQGPYQQASWYGHQQNYSNQLSPAYQYAQQNQWQHDPYTRQNPQFQKHQLYQQYLRNQQYHYQQQERPLSSRRGMARSKRDNKELAQDEADKEDGKAEVSQDKAKAAKAAKHKSKASPGSPRAKDKPERAPSDLIVVSTRPGQPGDRAILECTAPDDAASEASEENAADRRKTLLVPVQLSNISQVMFDDDLFEDEEEEDKESDEVVVVEDKPSISHKQAQSAHLLAGLQRMEGKRGATAPAAHLSPVRPLPPASPRRLRPKTSPFVGKMPSRAQKSYRCYGSMASRPTTVGTVGSASGTISGDVCTRPGTVDSKPKSPAETERAASKPDWARA